MDPPTRPRRKQAPMENILPDTAQSSIESSVDLEPEDSISQIASKSSSTGLTEEIHDLESSPIRTDSNISLRTRGLANSCKHCQKWSIKDSARSTSTTNMSS
ncbi:hypothetical protein V1507DRAFT_482651 [Lipomyces tetrasporus]